MCSWWITYFQVLGDNTPGSICPNISQHVFKHCYVSFLWLFVLCSNALLSLYWREACTMYNKVLYSAFFFIKLLVHRHPTSIQNELSTDYKWMFIRYFRMIHKLIQKHQSLNICHSYLFVSIYFNHYFVHCNGNLNALWNAIINSCHIDKDINSGISPQCNVYYYHMVQ